MPNNLGQVPKGAMPLKFSPSMREVLLKNNLDFRMYHDPRTGQFFIDARGVGRTDFGRVVREITPQQADLLSRYGYNSTDRKVYNMVKHLLPEATLPQELEMARNARNNPWHWSPVNMYGSPLGPDHRSRLNPTMPRAPFWRNRPSGPGDRVAPGSMPHYSIRDGRVLPTTGVFARRTPVAAAAPAQLDVLANAGIQVKLQKPEPPERIQGKGLQWSKEVTSPVYFTTEKLQEVLSSHGIDIDAKEKTLTIRSSGVRADLRYKLTDEQLAKLMNPRLLPSEGGVSLEERLKVINDRIAHDFKEPVTKEMLKSKNLIDIHVKDEVREEVEKPLLDYERQEALEKARLEAEQKAKEQYMAEEGRIRRDERAVSGREVTALLGGAFFNEATHGREAVVTEIRVDPPKKLREQDKADSQKVYDNLKQAVKGYEQKVADLKREAKDISRQLEGNPANREELERRLNEVNAKVRGLQNDIEFDRKWMEYHKDIDSHQDSNYTMRAVINGEEYARIISKSDYEKFMRYDDAHRLKLFAELCDKVKIGDAPVMEQGKPYDIVTLADGRMMTREELKVTYAIDRAAYGEDLRQMAPDRGFFREGKHGREVNVRQVSVEPSREGKFQMTAVINGQSVSLEISQKQYDKFLAVDDYQRMRMVSKVFDEFDMKVRPSDRMAMASVSLGTAAADDMYMAHKPSYKPSVFVSHMEGAAQKPADIAMAKFEQASEQQESAAQAQSQSTGQGRSMG